MIRLQVIQLASGKVPVFFKARPSDEYCLTLAHEGILQFQVVRQNGLDDEPVSAICNSVESLIHLIDLAEAGQNVGSLVLFLRHSLNRVVTRLMPLMAGVPLVSVFLQNQLSSRANLSLTDLPSGCRT